MRLFRTTLCLAALAGVLVLPAAASASVEDFALQIQASNPVRGMSEVVTIPLSELDYDPVKDEYSWSPNGDLELYNPSDPLLPVAILNSAEFKYTFGDVKKLNASWNVSAGEGDTEVWIRTGTMLFPTLPASETIARATTSIGVSDQGPGDGDDHARIEEVPSNGEGIYEAFYTPPSQPEVKFAGLIAWADINGSGSGSASQSQPDGVGFDSLNAEVNRMRTAFHFNLSAGDQGTATSNFFLLPEPASMLLLLGVAGLIRRR